MSEAIIDRYRRERDEQYARRQTIEGELIRVSAERDVFLEEAKALREKLNSYIAPKGQCLACSKDVADAYSALRIERDEESRWRKWLQGWGGTPEIVEQFIKGQQERIRFCQDLDAEVDRLRSEIKRKDAALRDAIDAFARYEMDADDDAPPAHREMMTRIRAALSSAEEGSSPEIPDGWTLSKCGQFIERKGDGVWIKQEGVAYYSCFSGEWCVLPCAQDASIVGVEYRLPWPPMAVGKEGK